MNGFYLEVHYEGTEVQNEAIKKVLTERGKTVYATSLMNGAIIVDNGNIKLIGDVKMFNCTNIRKSDVNDAQTL